MNTQLRADRSLPQVQANPRGDEVKLNYVGIDVHKQSLQAAIVDENGCLLDEGRFRNDREGILQLIDRTGYYGSFQAVVESSANYWTRLFDLLEENHVPVKLSNPYRTKAIAEAKVKTDKVDGAPRNLCD
jgi:transposase